MWAQPAPLPNRALFPFLLFGPRRVTHSKAQGPGPLLQSHSGSPCFMDLLCSPALVAPGSFVVFWRMERAQSDFLPSSQELIYPWTSSLAAFPTGWDVRETERLGIFAYSAPSWIAKHITFSSQISKWKNGKLNSLWTFLVCGGVLVVFLGFSSAKHVGFSFFNFF